MTAEEKKLLQNSARLCQQRNGILAQIEAEQKKKVLVPSVQKTAEQAADSHVGSLKNRKIRIKNVLKAGALALIPLLGTFIPDGFIALLSLIASFAVFFFVYVKLEKKSDEAEKAKFIEENRAKYEEERKQALEHNNQIQKNVGKLQGVLAQIEQSLNDPNQCCLHSAYWYAGPDIYRLVEIGRADSLKEAINLYEDLREREIAKAQAAQAAENQRWAELQRMMDEGSSKYDEQKKKHWEEFEKTAIITSLFDD